MENTQEIIPVVANTCFCGGNAHVIMVGGSDLGPHSADTICVSRCLRCGFTQEGKYRDDAIIAFRNACATIAIIEKRLKTKMERGAV